MVVKVVRVKIWGGGLALFRITFHIDPFLHLPIVGIHVQFRWTIHITTNFYFCRDSILDVWTLYPIIGPKNDEGLCPQLGVR